MNPNRFTFKNDTDISSLLGMSLFCSFITAAYCYVLPGPTSDRSATVVYMTCGRELRTAPTADGRNYRQSKGEPSGSRRLRKFRITLYVKF